MKSRKEFEDAFEEALELDPNDRQITMWRTFKIQNELLLNILDALKPTTKRICPHCYANAVFSWNWSHCPYCGNTLNRKFFYDELKRKETVPPKEDLEHLTKISTQ